MDHRLEPLRRGPPPALVACLLLSACGNGEDCPPTARLAVVDLADVSHRRLELEFDGAAAYAGTERYDFAFPGDAVPVDEHLLQVRARTVVADSRRAGSSGSWLDWFIGPARALDCSFPGETVQRLTALELHSDAALSGALPAGASLVGAARARYAFPLASDMDRGGVAPGLTFVSVPDGGGPTLARWQADRPRAPLTLGIRLDVDVDVAAEHRFTLTYSVDSGESFTLTTAPITLAPSGP